MITPQARALILCIGLSAACSSDEPKPSNFVAATSSAGRSSSATGGGAGIQSARTMSDAADSTTAAAMAGMTGTQAMTSLARAVAGSTGSISGASAPNADHPNSSASAGRGAATAGGSAGLGSAGASASAGASGAKPPAGASEPPDKSQGCGKMPPASDSSVMVGNGTGTFILDVPSNYDNNHAYPLVFSWHGAGVTNSAFHDYLNLHQVIGNDAILVTPECPNGGSMWPYDASYFDALLEHLSASYCIDTGHVFTTGHSMGGMHTALLGCLRADKLRGDAVLAAPHSSGQCVKGKMAAMMSVGMSDAVASYMTEFAYWSMYGGCDMTMKNPVDPMSFYKGALDESGVCTDYGGCAADTPVRTCTFSGGHEIPPWVASAVWDFFKKL